MGCDIHGNVQRKYAHGNQKWGIAEPIEDNRNYSVFSVLANVRNGGNITPIADPRGLPEDNVHFETKYFGNNSLQAEADYGDHSQSYLYLSELLAYDWNQVITDSGWVDRSEYEKMQAEGRSQPGSWCGGVAGTSVIHANAVENQWPEGWNYVYCEWTAKLSDYCATFVAWLNYIKHKYAWLLEQDPQAIRLVFGFDS